MKYEYEDIDPNTRIYNINGEKRKFKYVFYDAMLTLKFYPDTVYESIDECDLIITKRIQAELMKVGK